MTRAEKRALKKQIINDIKEFLKIQAHYFPDLIEDIKKIMDARNQSYVIYEIEVTIFVMILKNICSIESMQEMNELFNEDTCVKNIYKVLGLEEKDYLPHYVTINECLSKLDNKELGKIRKKWYIALSEKEVLSMENFWAKNGLLSWMQLSYSVSGKGTVNTALLKQSIKELRKKRRFIITRYWKQNWYWEMI